MPNIYAKNFESSGQIAEFSTLTSTTTPLIANDIFIEPIDFNFFHVEFYSAIRGTIFADQDGTLELRFSSDQTNIDGLITISYVANTQQVIDEKVYSPYLVIAYTNGPTAQATFRLFVFSFNGSI